MINKAIIIGHSTKDAELRYTQTGKQVTTFTLAVDRDFKNAQGEREADFIPCVAWGKLAEICEKYVAKGKQIAVCGRIQTRTYDDQNGQRRYITEIIVNDLQLLGSRQDGQAPQEQPQQPFAEIDQPDDLPF
jgi:single-strand DNA-binding protein